MRQTTRIYSRDRIAKTRSDAHHADRALTSGALLSDVIPDTARKRADGNSRKKTPPSMPSAMTILRKPTNSPPFTSLRSKLASDEHETDEEKEPFIKDILNKIHDTELKGGEEHDEGQGKRSKPNEDVIMGRTKQKIKSEDDQVHGVYKTMRA
jgi:hypothetical protein